MPERLSDCTLGNACAISGHDLPLGSEQICSPVVGAVTVMVVLHCIEVLPFTAVPVYVVVWKGETATEVPEMPDRPEIEKPLAFLVVHERRDVPPEVIEAGVATREQDGDCGGALEEIATCFESELPSDPVHESVYEPMSPDCEEPETLMGNGNEPETLPSALA